MASAPAIQELSDDLYALLRKVDPASFRDEFDSDARAQLERVERRAKALLSTSAESTAPESSVRVRVDNLLAAVTRARTAAPAASKAFWTRFQREVHPAYESLAATLRKSNVPAQTVRPTNYARNAFHVASALVAFVILALAPSRAWIIGAAAAFFTSAWTMETSRRFSPAANDVLMRLFGPVAHAHERDRVNSATWYATALLILAVAVKPVYSAVAVAVLGLADPAAAIIGRRFGRTRLRAGRSLEGTMAFVVVAFVTSYVTLAVIHPMHLGQRLLCALAAAVAGALAELFSTRVDDNLSIPVVTATFASLAAFALGGW